MMNAILEYYKSQKLPEFSGMLQEVWDDIFEDLEINVSKRQAKRDTMLRNAKRNPKLNTTPNTTPDIGPDTEPNIVPNTSGMVDGRLEMGDVGLKMDDREIGDDKGTPTSLHPNSSISQSLRLAGVKSIDEYWS